MTFILIIIAVIIIFYFVFKHKYKQIDNNIVLYIGTAGSGKTLVCVKSAIRKYRNMKLKWYFSHLVFWKKPKEKPVLYSNIPIRINSKKYAQKLTLNQLLLKEHINTNCVVLIDEIGNFASQMDYKNPLVDKVEIFIRYFRHITKGGYIYCNDQHNSFILNNIRRRVSKMYILDSFRKYWHFAFTNVTKVYDIEDVVTNVDSDETDDLTGKRMFIWIPFTRLYDTYSYYWLNPIVKSNSTEFDSLESKEIIQLKGNIIKPDDYDTQNNV